jgi:hypothetical protein
MDVWAAALTDLKKELLPDGSAKDYIKRWDDFNDWRSQSDYKEEKDPTDDMVLAYFIRQRKTFAPTTLWSQYSMINKFTQIKYALQLFLTMVESNVVDLVLI